MTEPAIYRIALTVALTELDKIAGASIPDCPPHYAGDELAWAQRHVANLRQRAEVARDGIRAALNGGFSDDSNN